MKTAQQIINSQPEYYHIFEDADSVWGKFNVSDSDRAFTNILFASYEYEDYSGSAFVICENEGLLYEVSGGHCSCYGLEGQWQPELIVLGELEHRVIKGRGWDFGGAKNELIKFLDLEAI